MPKCRRINTPDSKFHGWYIHCPACNSKHVFDSRWAFNGDQERPTFEGSYLQYKDNIHPRCHSFVTDGQIKFLADCTHDLAGQTVPLQDLDEQKGLAD